MTKFLYAHADDLVWQACQLAEEEQLDVERIEDFFDYLFSQLQLGKERLLEKRNEIE